MIEHTSRSIYSPSGNILHHAVRMSWAFPSLPIYHNGGNSLIEHPFLSLHLRPSASIIVTMLFFNCLKAFFSQDERWWTPMNPDEVSFDRLDDRAYQPVNSHPFGHGITLCCRRALSVSFIAALSQWRKQYNWASVFVITSVSICVYPCYNAFFNCLKAYFSQDEHGWTPINPDKVSFDRLDDRTFQPVNIQPFGRNLAPGPPTWAERFLHCRSITMRDTV